MISSFDPGSRSWHRQFPQSLSQHDLVYLTPPEDALQGLPLGNGDLGLLLWTEGSRLMAVINKVDLFDDFPGAHDGSVGAPPYDEEPTLRHGARLIVDFAQPLFDTLFSEDFCARLSLADASAKITLKTPLISGQIDAFVSSSARVAVLDFTLKGAEALFCETRLEHYGSRPYSYWYSQLRRAASLGLAGTTSEIQQKTLLIRQELRQLHFVVAARLQGKPHHLEKLNSHSGRFKLKKENELRFSLFLTIVTSENDPDPAAAALAILDAAEKEASPQIKADHAAVWQDFWQASFIDLPDDYLTNIWHLNLYYANSACRGAWPPRFNNGLWSWNRDIANWVYFFHWNTQNFIWPLHAANHAELAEPYFKYRHDSLTAAKKYAEKFQGLTGAFFADVADRLGNNVGSHWDNHTPGAQIALLFWQHYLYTNDEQFLREKAWPVLAETARYYAALVKKDATGQYYSPSSQAYEGSPLFANVITDTAMIKALLPVAAKCANQLGLADNETEKWLEIACKMNDFHTQPILPDEYSVNSTGDKVFTYGLGQGEKALTGKVFSVGRYLGLPGADKPDFNWASLPGYMTKPLADVKKGDWLRSRFGNPARLTYYGTPDPEISPVFPAGLIGLKDKDSLLYNISVDQIRLHPITDTDQPVEQTGMSGQGSRMCMGWCPYPIVLARLGLAAEAATAVKNSISAWQFYEQGFGHYGPYEVFNQDKDKRWHKNMVQVRDSNEKVASYAWPYRHFTLEAIPIACTALNEMLLQSYDGTIRLLPAVPASWRGSFKLAAVGAFIIHTEFASGRPVWLGLESKKGNELKLINPWPAATVYCIEQSADKNQLAELILKPVPLPESQDELIILPTKSDHLYLLADQPFSLADWQVREKKFSANQGVKELGQARLGLPRMF